MKTEKDPLPFISALAISKAAKKPARLKFKAPKLMDGVVPEGRQAAVTMDDAMGAYTYSNNLFSVNFQTFPGYPYLAALTTRAEFRQISTTIANEMTRGWITITSTKDGDVDYNNKIKDLEKAMDDFDIKQNLNQAILNEGLFGRGQMYIEVDGHNMDDPLVISHHTIKKGSVQGFRSIEPMWTTPSVYNALKPYKPDFYKPRAWFMLGEETHASRLLTFVTRPLPDMLKPSYNFSGMSLSQMAEAYVDNWLRTRQAVSDLVNNFSTTALATDMSQTLMGGNGSDIDARADLFTMLKSNRGMMLINKETEELVQLNVPLSGLSDLQSQALEHICSVTRIPAMIYTGISPAGMNASSDGEIRIFYDWILSQLEAHYRDGLQSILEIIQLHLWGEIDPDIGFSFNPLWEQSYTEMANVRKMDADTAAIYIANGVIDPSEVREKLAHDPESGYQGLDLSIEILNPNEGNDNPFEDNNDDPFKEHPFQENESSEKGVSSQEEIDDADAQTSSR